MIISHEQLTRYHERIREAAESFSGTSKDVAKSVYEEILREYVHHFNPKLHLQMFEATELSPEHLTETWRVNIVYENFNVFISPFFFTYPIGAIVSSMPMAPLLFIACAAKRFNEPMFSTTIELNDRGFAPSLTQSGCHPDCTLIPDLSYILSYAYSWLKDQLSTYMQKDNRQKNVFWRGSTTGARRYEPKCLETDFRWLARLEMCHRVNKGPLREVSDVKFSKVVQIDHPERFENILRSEGLFGDYVNQLEFSRYAIVIDIDGNSNSWPGFFSGLLSGSCVVKIASEIGFKQWYYDRLEPWVHYVPVKSDLSDLEENVLRVYHDGDLCKQIGHNGRRFALNLTFDEEISGGIDAVARTMARSSDYDLRPR